MSIIASGTTSGTALVSTGNTNGNLVFQTNGTTTAMTIDTSQNVTLATGNLVIGTSGKGIDFSATPGTGTSELLADYEEGTWTPTFTGTSTAGSGTYTFQAGSYTKVGRLVTIYGAMQFGSGTGTGNLQISGLPFSSNNFGSITIVLSDNLAFTAGSTLAGYTSGTNIQLQQIPSGGSGSTAAVPYDANIAQFIFFGSYFTS